MDSKWKVVIVVLILAAVSVWLAALSSPKSEELHLIVCDVGQGDAILATLGENQVLVDGGPNTAVTNCLDNNLPFYDRNIELVILTHPQYDHYRGLIDVFERYSVDYILASGLDSDSQGYKELKEAISLNGSRVVSPDSGKLIRVGEVSVEVVHPSMAFQASESTDNTLSEGEGKQVLGSYTTGRNPNDFSVVINLSYDDFDALLTGDIGPEVVDEVISTGLITATEYLKVPHHGSKNGLTQELLDSSTPEIAVISVGKNQWGHPHEEVLNLLDDYEVKLLRTDANGEIEVVTNGESWWIE